jgi:hypothetical protein
MGGIHIMSGCVNSVPDFHGSHGNLFTFLIRLIMHGMNIKLLRMFVVFQILLFFLRRQEISRADQIVRSISQHTSTPKLNVRI